MNKEDKRLTINDLTIDDYLKDFKRAIDENEWYEIEGRFLKPLYEQIINLQQENKQQEEYIFYWQNEYDKKMETIDKAIEYIGKPLDNYWQEEAKDLLEILKGDSNE